MNIPNLFIIGAMKSSTTSLHHYLSFHPQLFMCEPKEPGYFNQEKPSEKFTAEYYGLFKDAKPQHKYLGDGSTDYAKIPQYENTVDRIKKVSPQAKIIYVMRDPYKRLISHYWHTVRPQKSDGQTKDLYSAVKSFEGYLAFSDYPRQIKPYIEAFGRENIYFIAFEEITKNPKPILLDLFKWLDISDEFNWDVLSDQLNARPEVVTGATGFGIMHRLSHTRLWDFLAKLFPKNLKTWLRNIAIKEIDPKSQKANEEKIKQEYQEYFARITKEIAEISGKSNLKDLWGK